MSITPLNRARFVAVTLTALVPAAANGALTITYTEAGPNVVEFASGALNLDGLTRAPVTTAAAGMNGVSGTDGIAYLGGTDMSLSRGYSGLSGPSSFGTGGVVNASSQAGDQFILNAHFNYLYVADNYIFGAPLVNNATFANTTLSMLGLTVGQYVYVLPHDTVTINITPNVDSSVPEPAGWVMMAAGFGAIGWALRRRHMPVQVSFA
jgi:hypothetical protein